MTVGRSVPRLQRQTDGRSCICVIRNLKWNYTMGEDNVVILWILCRYMCLGTYSSLYTRANNVGYAMRQLCWKQRYHRRVAFPWNNIANPMSHQHPPTHSLNSPLSMVYMQCRQRKSQATTTRRSFNAAWTTQGKRRRNGQKTSAKITETLPWNWFISFCMKCDKN